MTKTININTLLFDAMKVTVYTESELFGNIQPTYYLLSVSDLTEYVDGKATGKVIGSKYVISVLEKSLDKITVKVENAKPIVTNEQIKEHGGIIKVRLKNLKGKVYFNDRTKEYTLSYKAEGLEVMQ